MKANDVFNKVAPVIERLSNRWMDESQYEDWKDYEKVLKDAITGQGVRFVRASNTPFEVVFDIPENGRFKIKVKETRINMYALPMEG